MEKGRGNGEGGFMVILVRRLMWCNTTVIIFINRHVSWSCFGETSV